MKIDLPQLDFSAQPEAIHRNREAIREAREVLKGAIKALEGLHQANVGLCKHPNKTKHYDPGYGGGGYSHSECADCGGQLP